MVGGRELETLNSSGFFTSGFPFAFVQFIFVRERERERESSVKYCQQVNVLRYSAGMTY
jgi:hypothetical protein